MNVAQLCIKIKHWAHVADCSRVVPPPRNDLGRTEKPSAPLNVIKNDEDGILVAPSQNVMARHRAITCDNAVENNWGRRGITTPGARTNAVPLNDATKRCVRDHDVAGSQEWKERMLRYAAPSTDRRTRQRGRAQRAAHEEAERQQRGDRHRRSRICSKF